MNTFTIDRNSTSFRYLSRWNNSYKWLLNSGDTTHVAHDFCSYYRDVLSLMFFQFFMALFIPAMLYFNVNIWVFHYLPDAVTFNLIWQIPMVIMGFFGTLMLVMYSGYMIVSSIYDYIIKPLIRLLPARKRDYSIKKKQPGVIKTWYEGFKGNYCPTIKYDDTLIQRSTTEEE